MCDCHDGYTGNGVTCNDVDECDDGTHDCDLGATCTNTSGSFSCACPDHATGNGVSCTCDLNGTFVVRTETDVEWDPLVIFGVTILSGGSDTLYSWSIRRQTQTGSTIESETIPCGGTSQTICSPFFNEAYSQMFPLDIWGRPSMPISMSTMTFVDPDPTDAFVGAQETALLGLSVSTAGTTWPPLGSPNLTWIDHDDDDGDGEDDEDGVVSHAVLTGTACGNRPYAPAPLPSDPFGPRGVVEASIGSRAIFTYQGTLDDCSTVTGNITGPNNGKPLTNGHVLACTLDNGDACSADDVAELDNQATTASQRIVNARFRMVRVANDAITCTEARDELPAP
jgi:hypothetical protein